MKFTNQITPQEVQNPAEAIPNLDELYNVLRDFIKKHQGEKGYIDTQNQNGEADTIYGVEYLNYVLTEVYVKAVGVNENGEILIVTDNISSKVIWTEDDFLNPDNWNSLRYSDIYFTPTLFSICENICEYVSTTHE